MEKTISEKLQLLRNAMKEQGIDTFLLTKMDPHGSEYSKIYWNYVKYFSGFTGSAGTLVVTHDKAAFWTDGRYTLQSEKELKGTEFIINNTSEPKCISYARFIFENTKENGCFSFDERTLDGFKAEEILKDLESKGVTYKSGIEIIAKAWPERVALEASKVFSHDIKYCGVSRSEKIESVRKAMAEKQAKWYIISCLQDIAWLLNLRSKTDASLSFEAYCAVSTDKTILFADGRIIEDVKSELNSDNIEICDYNELYNYIATNFEENETVSIAPSRTCFALFNALEKFNIVNLDYDITTNMKAVKNAVEIENTKRVSIIDGASVVKFIKWIKEACKSGNLTEYEAGKKLDSIREANGECICPSFSTILGFGPSGSIIHYHALENDSLTLKPEGLVLVDSGGNYLGGTTDITRTIVLGELTEEMKHDFTLVLKCHIGLAKAVFTQGTNGHYVDILARLPLLEEMKDFKHGTGHGIGFALSVHEGPHRIASQPNNVALKPGMMISNEPGFYKNGEYGIRSENIVLVKEMGSSAFGNFYCFETISFAPFDLEAIDASMLTQSEKDWLNNYHDEVYEKLSPLLDDEEKAWLKTQTRHI